MQKCDVIEADSQMAASEVKLMAVGNQLVRDIQVNGKMDFVDIAEINIIQDTIANSRDELNAKYSTNIANITWDDFAQCKSLSSAVYDQQGSAQPGYWNRRTLAPIGRVVKPKYIARTVLADNSLMQSAVDKVPLSWDSYVAPEIVVLFILMIVTAIIYRLMTGKDDDTYDNDDNDRSNASTRRV